MKSLVKVSALILFLVAMILLAPLATHAAAPALCSANPSTAVVGTKITITCSGFDPNTSVNTYVVEPTGFTEVSKYNYTACIVNSQGGSGETGKVNEKGDTTFYWFSQNGVNTCPTYDYTGYANQIGTYTVVVQELDGVGGIKYKGTVQVTLNGNSQSYSGAMLVASSPVVVVGTLQVAGSGFVPGEPVSLWFTRPADCSGMGNAYWTGVSAFDPANWGYMSGVEGPGNLKADGNGNFNATYVFGNPKHDYMPCLGTWSVTARAVGSGRGAKTTFLVEGQSVANNAKVWTTESSVPSIGQTFGGGYGIGVHVYGSGFPAGSSINCWFTRPDGTTYDGYVSAQTDAGGNFAAVAVTYTSAIAYQGEQLGRWAVTCGTPDGKYSGVAWFDVIGLLDP